MGRPSDDWSVGAKQAYCETLNASPRPENVGKCDKRQYYFKRGCGKHYARISVEHANKPATEITWQMCDFCNLENSKASSLEIKAAKMFQDCCGGCYVVTQARVLPKTCGPIDFMLIWFQDGTQQQLLVEVDGMQHYKGRMHATTWKQQGNRDRTKDKEIIKREMKLLRLHGEDESIWREELKMAMQLARNKPEGGFVHYSDEYRQKLEHRDKMLREEIEHPTINFKRSPSNRLVDERGSRRRRESNRPPGPSS